MIKWRRRATEYYEAKGFSGIQLVITRADVKDLDGSIVKNRWVLYAGDNTAIRSHARTRRELKSKATMLFG